MATPPTVSAPVSHAQRTCAGGGEEWFGGRGTPVDEQLFPVRVGESDPADVVWLSGLIDDPSEAQIEAVPAHHGQSLCGLVDLEIAIHRLPAHPRGRGPQLCEATAQQFLRAHESRCHRREVAFVVGDEFGGGLGWMCGEVEHGGGDGRHGRLRRVGGIEATIVRDDGGLAARPPTRVMVKVAGRSFAIRRAGS